MSGEQNTSERNDREKDQSANERNGREKKNPIRSDTVSIEITWAELDEVAKKVGVENGKVMYAMLTKPMAMAQVDDYVDCVARCSNLLGDKPEALVACINGCATVTKGDGTLYDHHELPETL